MIRVRTNANDLYKAAKRLEKRIPDKYKGDNPDVVHLSLSMTSGLMLEMDTQAPWVVCKRIPILNEHIDGVSISLSELIENLPNFKGDILLQSLTDKELYEQKGIIGGCGYNNGVNFRISLKDALVEEEQ